MIELTEDQRHQLEDGKAVEVTDSQTARRYVLLRKEIYETVRRVLCDDPDWSDDELRLQLARSAPANGWNDPKMDAYDRYDEERRKPCP